MILLWTLEARHLGYLSLTLSFLAKLLEVLNFRHALTEYENL